MSLLKNDIITKMNARHAIGVATFWGMLTASVVGMLFVPPLYVFFRRLAGVKG